MEKLSIGPAPPGGKCCSSYLEPGLPALLLWPPREAFFSGQSVRVETTALHRVQKRSTLARVGFEKYCPEAKFHSSVPWESAAYPIHLVFSSDQQVLSYHAGCKAPSGSGIT